MESEGNDNLFYSRRIGRRPQGSSYNYYGHEDTLEGYSDSPDRTSILGAAKLTGKTQNGLSVGFMDAVTGEEMAEIDTSRAEIIPDSGTAYQLYGRPPSERL